MNEIQFKRENGDLIISREINESNGLLLNVLIRTNDGGAVSIEVNTFSKYIDDYKDPDQTSDYSISLVNGFASAGSDFGQDVVLTHSTAKIIFSGAEFEQLKKFARGLAA